jgi:hypothetical protein
MGTPQLKFDEWCPSCGDGVDKLNPITGFCFSCSPSIDGKIPCENCGKDFFPYQNSRKTCNDCRNLEWLQRNADSIERVMVHYEISVIEAIQKVHDDNRPRCAMCGDKIKHGTKGRSVFCKKRDECRRAAVRFSNYRKRNNMSDDEALERALHGSRQQNIL